MISKLHELYLKHGVVTTDTRKISKDSIYFALKGENFDGNAFALQSLELGASYAVVDDPNITADNRIILVPNVLKALQELALFHRKYLSIPIIGITGSNGKTTTKELIREVLSQKYNVISTQGNLNNHIGVPLTILSMNSSTEIGIVEMGANHPGDIAELCAIALPNYGIITNIGAAHLEGFGSFEGVIKTKNELYQIIIATKGTLFCNSENEILKNLIKDEEVKVIFYGKGNDDYAKGELLDSNSFLKLKASFGNKKELLEVNTNLLGGYNFENVLASLCIGKFFEVEENAMNQAISNYNPSNNRSQLLKTETNTVWVDCYNANPSSMKAAITHFSKSDVTDNLVVILGDMLELGVESTLKHAEIIELVKQQRIKTAYYIGEQFKLAGNELLQFNTVDELILHLEKEKISNKSILVKGSRGIKLEKVLPIL